MAKSVFDPSSQGDSLRTGANANLGPTGISTSKMPESLVDGKVEEDDRPLNCKGADADEPACEIKRSLDELSDEEPHGGESACQMHNLQNPEE